MRLLFFLFITLATAQCHRRLLPNDQNHAPAQSPNTSSANASTGGSGRFYEGREIALVMGHEGAGWLERPEREREERTDLLMQELALRPTMTVADIGAGTGYFSFRMAPLVPQGRVLAVDIQPEMLAEIERRKIELKLPNVQAVQGTEKAPNLPPNSVDMVLLVDAYHEFTYPREMMAGIYKSLKPGGRVALVEFRGEDPAVAIKPAHKMTVAQARKEWQAVGFTFREVRESLPQQHLIFFEKSPE